MIQLDMVIDVVIVYSSFCNMVLLKMDVSSLLGWVLEVNSEEGSVSPFSGGIGG